MGVCTKGNQGQGWIWGQTGPSCSEMPELKTRDTNANMNKLEAFSVSWLNCAALQATLGSGMGAGVWALLVVLLPAWGKPLPHFDFFCPWSCIFPSHDILPAGTSQSQLKNTIMNGSVKVQAWPDMVKGNLPQTGVSHCCSGLLINFLWPVNLGCAACSPVSVDPSDPILALSHISKHLEIEPFANINSTG